MLSHPPAHVQQARYSIGFLWWLTLVSIALLPFSFSVGVADWRYLLVALAAGAVWLVMLIGYWRTENLLLSGASFVAVIGVYHLSEIFYDQNPPLAHFIQWMNAFLLTSGVPLMCCRDRVLKFCGLVEGG